MFELYQAYVSCRPDVRDRSSSNSTFADHFRKINRLTHAARHHELRITTRETCLTSELSLRRVLQRARELFVCVEVKLDFNFSTY